ncbi:MAG: hypothetical protein D8H94_06205 [Cardiobacterium sp.]|nr:MAG: hypothetical protein D8H94_06205 [Cardiobacterium sp.]
MGSKRALYVHLRFRQPLADGSGARTCRQGYWRVKRKSYPQIAEIPVVFSQRKGDAAVIAVGGEANKQDERKQ